MSSAAIYARVSSARQKKDETIGSQTAALAGRVRAHARESGNTISAVVTRALTELLARGRRNNPRR